MGIWKEDMYMQCHVLENKVLDDLGHGLEACKMRGGWRLQGKVKKEIGRSLCVGLCVIGRYGI